MQNEQKSEQHFESLSPAYFSHLSTDLDLFYTKSHYLTHFKPDSVVIFTFRVKIKNFHIQSQLWKRHLSANFSQTHDAISMILIGYLILHMPHNCTKNQMCTANGFVIRSCLMSFQEAFRTGVFFGFEKFVFYSAILTDLDIFYIKSH